MGGAKSCGSHMKPLHCILCWLFSKKKEKEHCAPAAAALRAPNLYLAPVELKDQLGHDLLKYLAPVELEDPLGHDLLKYLAPVELEDPLGHDLLKYLAPVELEDPLGHVV